MQRLEEEVARAERQGSSLGLMLVGFENLDELAEHEGALLREQALAHAARALRPRLRRFDQIGRPRAGELAIVLPGADGARGELVARRLLERLRTIKLESGGTRRALRVAIGIAAWRTGMSGAALLEEARRAAPAQEGQPPAHAD